MVYETSGSTDRVTPDQLVSEVLETSLGSGVMSFVESGLTFDPDYGSEELTVTSGVAYILGDGQGLKLTPGETTVPLESGTVNYIYLVKPFTGFEVGYVVKTQDVAPAQTSLKVGTVDTGSDATQELNRGAALSPDKFGNDIDADGNDITNVGTFSSDEVSNVIYLNGRSPIDVINNAPAESLIICDPSNQHVISNNVYPSNPGVTVMGLNVKLADGANTHVITNTQDDLSYHYLTVDGNKANQSPPDQRHGIYNNDGDNITITNFEVRDTYDNGISNLSYKLPNLTIANGRVVNAGREGVRGAGVDGTVWNVRIENPGSRVQAGGAVPRAERAVWFVKVFGATDSGITVTAPTPELVVMGESHNNDLNGIEMIDSSDPYAVNIPYLHASGNGRHGLHSEGRVIGDNLHLHDNGEAGAKLNGSVQSFQYSQLSGVMYNNGQNTNPAEPHGVTGVGDVTDVNLDVLCWDGQSTETQVSGVKTQDSCDYWNLGHSNLRGQTTAFSLAGTNNVTSDVIQ